MSRNIQLIAIDPQNDFCDLPESWHAADAASGRRIAPALPVAGAHADMLRLANLIRAGGKALDRITVTLDSHHRLHIAHPTFWQKGDGSAVAPFTQITADEVRAGAYRPRDTTARARALAYIDALEARGRYRLMVWPVHCEIGTWGHNVHTAVRAACSEWEEQKLSVVEMVQKGSNMWTEHYSALQAEVPDAEDPGTLLNRSLLQSLDEAELLLVAGEASSHCVKATVEDIVDNLPGGRPDRIVLLTDCMSPVGGFQSQSDDFLRTMRERGVRSSTAADAIRTWLR
jgi:nicotinamidase/pyrazinamidase